MAFPAIDPVIVNTSDEGREKVLALERDRKKKQDRRFLTRKLLEDLEAILPGDGTSMRRTLHRILEDCIEHVKSVSTEAGLRDDTAQMPPEFWKEGLLSSQHLGVGTLSSQFCFTECSPGMCDVVGKDYSSIVGTDLFSLFQAQDGIHMMQKLSRQRASGSEVQEVARLAHGGAVSVVITKSSTEPCTFCVVIDREASQEPPLFETSGQIRPRPEMLDFAGLESAVSSALKQTSPAESVEPEKPKCDIPYHPYLHGLRGFGASPPFGIFGTHNNVSSSPLVGGSTSMAFAPNLTQLPTSSALAQYVQALSASQSAVSGTAPPAALGRIPPSSSVHEAVNPFSPAAQSQALPSVSGLSLPLSSFLAPADAVAPAPSVPLAVRPPCVVALPPMAPAAAAAIQDDAPTPTAQEGGASSMSYQQQLKLQEQVERQYKQLNDLTLQLSTMKELISKHIPALAPNDGSAAGAHGSAAGGAAEEGASARAEERDKGAKPERRPRKMPATRNATVRWTRAEHHKFLEGLERLGTGQWSSISKYYVPTRTPAQVASHHQKFAIRSNMPSEWRQKPSILDITTDPVQKLMTASADH